MAAVATAASVGSEDVVVLHDIAWETYCQLNDENFSPTIRMAYFEGTLEIMTVSSRHENRERKIEFLIQTIASSMRLDSETYGSMTMRRKDLRAGLEPDACFYFGPMAAVMRGQEEISLSVDPAPDLAVEIDISRRSFSKFPLYAALGIREIWRFHLDEVLLYELVDRDYRPASESTQLPRITGTLLTRLLAEGRTLSLPEWTDSIRAAVNSL